MLDPTLLWKTVVDEVDVRVNSAPISAWLKQTKGISFNNGEIVVGCEHAYTRDFLQRQIGDVLNEVATKLAKEPVSVSWKIISPEMKQNADTPLFSQQILQTTNRSPQPGGVSLREKISHEFSLEQLNENYTLDKYVVGQSNRVAHAAARAVIENSGSAYNPLFIYGSTGVGKTHLMHAIGNGIRAGDPGAKVLYFTSEQFLNDLVEILTQKKQMVDFRKKYRSADCILVDDVQFFGGKESTQEEFYHTFNHLYQTGKQIVLASDRLPDDISNLADRLVSRFKGGLMVDIGNPDYETRFAIIYEKGFQLGLNLSNQVIELVSNLIPSNIREIEGALLKIKSEIVARGVSEVSIDMVRDMLGVDEHNVADDRKITYGHPRKKLTPELIFSLVTDEYGVSMRDLCGKRRKREIVVPRQLAMFMLRDELGMNYVDIGQLLGGRDHTTVMYGFDQVKKKIQGGDDELQKTLTKLRKEIYDY